MLRAVVVMVAALAIAGLTLGHVYAAASAIGVVLGAIFWTFGVMRNNGLVNASLRRDPSRPNDPNAGICMGLAAAGIAAGAIGHQPPFPLGFIRFYGFCVAAGLLIALTIAVRYRKPRPAGPSGIHDVSGTSEAERGGKPDSRDPDLSPSDQDSAVADASASNSSALN